MVVSLSVWLSGLMWKVWCDLVGKLVRMSAHKSSRTTLPPFQGGIFAGEAKSAPIPWCCPAPIHRCTQSHFPSVSRLRLQAA